MMQHACLDGTTNMPRIATILASRCIEHNDSEHLCAILPELLREHRHARRVHLIWDGGSSHIAEETLTFLRDHYANVRVLFTPAHASWLDQAELLLCAPLRLRPNLREDSP